LDCLDSFRGRLALTERTRTTGGSGRHLKIDDFGKSLRVEAIQHLFGFDPGDTAGTSKVSQRFTVPCAGIRGCDSKRCPTRLGRVLACGLLTKRLGEFEGVSDWRLMVAWSLCAARATRTSIPAHVRLRFRLTPTIAAHSVVVGRGVWVGLEDFAMRLAPSGRCRRVGEGQSVRGCRPAPPPATSPSMPDTAVQQCPRDGRSCSCLRTAPLFSRGVLTAALADYPYWVPSLGRHRQLAVRLRLLASVGSADPARNGVNWGSRVRGAVRPEAARSESGVVQARRRRPGCLRFHDHETPGATVTRAASGRQSTMTTPRELQECAMEEGKNPRRDGLATGSAPIVRVAGEWM
jgi:hypothetical protein